MKRKNIAFCALALLLFSLLGNSQTRPSAAFDQYLYGVEADLEQRHHSSQTFLRFNDAASRSGLRRGEVLIQSRLTPPIEGALIHHWVGSLFIPNAHLADFLQVAQDYPNLPRYYAPQVLSSRLLKDSSNHFTAEMRVQQHHVLTVVMRIVNEIDYQTLDSQHGFSASRSIEIHEIASTGTSQERLLAPDEDHGFLWRLNSYWSYVEEPDGLTLECEAISLTRDIPRGLGWLVHPFIQSVPRESLQFTLEATRKALLERSFAHVNQRH